MKNLHTTLGVRVRGHTASSPSVDFIFNGLCMGLGLMNVLEDDDSIWFVAGVIVDLNKRLIWSFSDHARGKVKEVAHDRHQEGVLAALASLGIEPGQRTLKNVQVDSHTRWNGRRIVLDFGFEKVSF